MKKKEFISKKIKFFVITLALLLQTACSSEPNSLNAAIDDGQRGSSSYAAETVNVTAEEAVAYGLAEYTNVRGAFGSADYLGECCSLVKRIMAYKIIPGVSEYDLYIHGNAEDFRTATAVKRYCDVLESDEHPIIRPGDFIVRSHQQVGYPNTTGHIFMVVAVDYEKREYTYIEWTGGGTKTYNSDTASFNMSYSYIIRPRYKKLVDVNVVVSDEGEDTIFSYGLDPVRFDLFINNELQGTMGDYYATVNDGVEIGITPDGLGGGQYWLEGVKVDGKYLPENEDGPRYSLRIKENTTFNIVLRELKNQITIISAFSNELFSITYDAGGNSPYTVYRRANPYTASITFEVPKGGKIIIQAVDEENHVPYTTETVVMLDGSDHYIDYSKTLLAEFHRVYVKRNPYIDAESPKEIQKFIDNLRELELCSPSSVYSISDINLEGDLQEFEIMKMLDSVKTPELAVCTPTPTAILKPSATPKPAATPTVAPTAEPNYSDWSEWSLTKPELKDGRVIDSRACIVGYYLKTFITQDASSFSRIYRNFSIDHNWSKYSARSTYGEHHYETYCSAKSLSMSNSVAPGEYAYSSQNTWGYNMGNETAYYGPLENSIIWFIDKPDYVTEYRYKDAIR